MPTDEYENHAQTFRNEPWAPIAQTPMSSIESEICPDFAEWFYHHSPEPLATLNLDGCLIAANRAFISAAGNSETPVAGRHLLEVLGQPVHSPLEKALRNVVESGSGRAVSLLKGRDNSETQWHLELTLDAELRIIFLVCRDQTKESRLAAEVVDRTVRDRLTGLINRDTLTDELSRAVASRQSVALFLIDVDNFTLINDTYGHPFGDDILTAISQRLVRAAGLRNTVSRIGGDQFAVMVRRISKQASIATAAEQLHDLLSQPILLHGTPVHLSVSVGVSHSFDGTADAMDLLREADTAVSRASAQGGGQVLAFLPGFHEEMEKRVRTERELRAALGTSQLDADVQGVLTLDSCELVGFEALARWRHPARGTVPPGEFIDAAERTGILDDVLSAVLSRSLETLAPWLAEHSDRHLSVNVAPSQLRRVGLVERFEEAFANYGVTPSQVRVEVTEKELVADPSSVATLHRLHELGISLAIDDFGAGASSLGYLWSLPVSELKLDRSLIQLLPTDRAVKTVVRSLVALATELNLDVVAEGVETAEQLSAVTEFGCTHVQGFYLHRPESLNSVTGHISPAAWERLSSGGTRTSLGDR